MLFLDPGSEIRDPGSGMGKNQDPGSGINTGSGSAKATVPTVPVPHFFGIFEYRGLLSSLSCDLPVYLFSSTVKENQKDTLSVLESVKSYPFFSEQVRSVREHH
jgi:hypothetical protein